MSSPQKAAVIFSGGQDSTTCLFLALHEFGPGNVEAITFQYGQRHAIELDKARWIAEDLGVKQTLIDTSVIKAITHNALLDESATISQEDGQPPNTFVDGRNALFLLYAAIHAKAQGIRTLYTGVCETDFSGYPDCRDVFVKSMNVTLNLAMDYTFDIRTPLMWLTKKDTWRWPTGWVPSTTSASTRTPAIWAWKAAVVNAPAACYASAACTNT